MTVHFSVITDGRRDCMERAMESAWSALHGTFTSRCIVDDSADHRYAYWLDWAYGPGTKWDCQIIHNPSRRGFGGAIQTAWRAVPPEAELVFATEDDFVFLEQIPIAAMARVLHENPSLIQLVLKRQPWNEQEKAAGGLVEMWPDEFTEHADGNGAFWTTHRLWYSTNPHLCRRNLVELGWPTGERSEQRFAEQLLVDPDARFAFWGRKLAPPKTLHIGTSRVGIGY